MAEPKQQETKKKQHIAFPEKYEKGWGGAFGDGQCHLHLFDRGMINNKHVGHLIVSMFLQFFYKGFDSITEQQKQDSANLVKNNIIKFWTRENWRLVPYQKKIDIPYDEILVKFSLQTAVEGVHRDDFEVTIHKGEGVSGVYTNLKNMDLFAGDGDHTIIQNPYGEEECVVAHEFGHCLGLNDEYMESIKSLDSDVGWSWWRSKAFIHGAPYRYDISSIMWSNQKVRLRHYWPFAQWVTKVLNQHYAVTDGNRIFFVKENLWEPFKYETGVNGQGGFGKYRLYFFPIGDDDFQEVLQRKYYLSLGQKINIIFDSLLVVRINLHLFFADYEGNRKGWSDDEKEKAVDKIEDIINEYWNSRFYLTADEGLYRNSAVLFDVRTLIDVGKYGESVNWSDDFSIEFREGWVKANYTKDTFGLDIILPWDCLKSAYDDYKGDYKGKKFWHHVGHLLGLHDETPVPKNSAGVPIHPTEEYIDFPPDTAAKVSEKYSGTDAYKDEKDSIMHSGNNVKWRHYWPFAKWLHKQTGVWYWVSDGSNKYDDKQLKNH